MKRTRLPQTLQLSILMAALCLSSQGSFSQDCNTQAANKPSTYNPNYQNFTNPEHKPESWNIRKMKPQLATVESWMRNMLRGFTGAKLMYGNDYFLDPGGTDFLYKATKLKGSYQAKMMFFQYYCYENKFPLYTEDESGSNLTVCFNNIFGTGLCSDMGVYTINGKVAFKMFEKISTEGRVDYYEQIGMSNVNDTIYKSKNEFIVIRNSDQPVFLPITRKEYLQQLFKDVDDYKIREIAFAKESYTPAAEAANREKFEADLKRIDNSKTSTPEQMAPYRKRFIETWETEKQKFDKRIARLEKETGEAKTVLQEYLKKPPNWLSLTFKQFYSYNTYAGKGIREYLERLDDFTFSKEDETRTFIASVNPAYFNASLGFEVPQVISVYIQKGRYPHMRKVADLVKNPGALAPLEAILSPGKQAVTLPLISATSTYSLSFLPKLTKLTPLIVPADMKPSVVAAVPGNNTPVNKFNFDIPAPSSKLTQLPRQTFSGDAYKIYVVDLQTKIAGAIKPEIKKKADEYVKNKKLTQSKDVSNTALTVWLQNTPKASLYLYSMAVAQNLSDGLAANNFSAFLIMGGLSEKAIPILNYWNMQQPGKATILANLGNAYYRLGDINNAMKYLQQCVQKDSLNATANKLLCMMYLKKGDLKKAEEHGTRSITTTHDQQVISILQQLNNKIKPGEVMSRFPPLPEKEFPMLKRINLPTMPSSLDEMEQFNIELTAIKESLKMTVDAIQSKIPQTADNAQQQLLVAGLSQGLPPIRIKAQYIIMDGMQVYHTEHIQEYDVFRHQLKKINTPYNIKVKAIHNNYNSQLNKLHGGEAGDEEKIAALQLAKCKALNDAAGGHLAGLSGLVNQYAARQEYISHKYYRDCANWAPYYFPEAGFSFLSIQKDYLQDVLNILDEYQIITKTNCDAFEPLPAKAGKLQQWEDEYCANFKGNIGLGGGKVTWTCKSWGIEAGEGIVGGFEANYGDDGSFEEVSFELGVGAAWHMGTENVAQMGAGASLKDFVKIGRDKLTGNWIVTDAGIKGEIAIEGELGYLGAEVKVIEVTAGYISGVNKEGVALPILELK